LRPKILNINKKCSLIKNNYLNKNWKFTTFHFLVIEFFTYWFHRFADILSAPFYFHFGHHWLFIEIVVLLTNLVDTIGLYYILFFFLIIGLICRNSTFQSYVKSFYKNYLTFNNTLPLSNYVVFFYNNFVKGISFLINKIYYYFKKRK
jgi:hypothetical protein